MRVQRHPGRIKRDPALAMPSRTAAASTCSDAARVELARKPMLEPGRFRRCGSTSHGGGAAAVSRPRTREIAVLAHVDGYTQEEVAG